MLYIDIYIEWEIKNFIQKWRGSDLILSRDWVIKRSKTGDWSGIGRVYKKKWKGKGLTKKESESRTPTNSTTWVETTYIHVH